MKTVIEYIEPTCPYCRYVYNHVLMDLLTRRVELNQKMQQNGIKKYIKPFEVKIIDIVANRGCKEEQWFQWYSRKIGGRYTPTIVVDKNVYYFWSGDKPDSLKTEKLERTAKLKGDLISALSESIFEKEPVLYDTSLLRRRVQV